jgi:nuclear GTP-binding protein
MRRIYLIDCPGVVPVSSKDSDTDTVLKGVVRVENLATPAEHIPDLLARVRPEYLERTYGLEPLEGGWVGEEGATIMLSAIAKRSGKLLRGGEPDQEAAAKMVLNDWIRGKIPYFAHPPERPAVDVKSMDTPGVAKGETDAQLQGTLAADQERNLGKVLGEKRIKGVEQPISKIVTMSKFLGDDARRHLEDEEADVTMEGQTGYEEGDQDENDEEEAETATAPEAEMAWEEIFDEAGPSKPAGPADKAVTEEDAEMLDDDEEVSDDEEEGEEGDEPELSAKQKGKRGEWCFATPAVFHLLINLHL